jgi:hypothetical protein
VTPALFGASRSRVALGRRRAGAMTARILRTVKPSRLSSRAVAFANGKASGKPVAS